MVMQEEVQTRALPTQTNTRQRQRNEGAAGLPPSHCLHYYTTRVDSFRWKPHLRFFFSLLWTDPVRFEEMKYESGESAHRAALSCMLMSPGWVLITATVTVSRRHVRSWENSLKNHFYRWIILMRRQVFFIVLCDVREQIDQLIGPM